MPLKPDVDIRQENRGGLKPRTGRPRVRNCEVPPYYLIKLRSWGICAACASELFGWERDGLNRRDVNRILNGDYCTAAEAQRVEQDIQEHGQRYKLPGWEEL